MKHGTRARLVVSFAVCIAVGSCSSTGGTEVACITEGNMYDGESTSLGVHCCSGLTRESFVSLMESGTATDGGTCAAGPLNLFICLRCGNGVCESAENHCNCAVDCP